MDIIKLYKKIVLPWRIRAEKAEMQTVLLSKKIHDLSHSLKDELDKNRR